MSNLEFLATSANGMDVFYDPISSHTATHFADTPQLKELTQDILTGTILNEDEMLFSTDMGRDVGKSDLVENDESDIVVYAKRKNRDVYTSFNKTKAPQPCSTVAIGVKRMDDHKYELTSAWIGSADSPPFPGDKNETPESKSYWLKHSLAWGTQEIQKGTEISVCPW
jgi:hypothetical protein